MKAINKIKEFLREATDQNSWEFSVRENEFIENPHDDRWYLLEGMDIDPKDDALCIWISRDGQKTEHRNDESMAWAVLRYMENKLKVEI